MKDKEASIAELKGVLNNQLSENYEVQNENSQIKMVKKKKKKN
jgi:hypothetical protein